MSLRKNKMAAYDVKKVKTGTIGRYHNIYLSSSPHQDINQTI